MNAIGYLRLSTKDQSKSLQYQESTIRDYCRRNELELKAVFKDNGEDSYTFDRPNYKALEEFIKKYLGQCQYLIVLDHDRFSRNLPEALMKITELEKKYGVKVISTNERVDIDTSDPDVFMKRAFDYMIANKELFTIRSRTKQGIRNARENGRYLGRAPFGYENVLDGTKRNLIRINPKQSVVVARIFREYILGVPPYIIYKSAKEMGFKHTGSNAIFDILKNPLHAGLIRVPAYKNLPEKLVKGIHEAIVSETDFYLVQKMLSQKRRMQVRTDEDFPMRGVLKCWCGTKMTAGWTKGCRHYYLYYRCIDHTNVNIPGPRLHEEFAKVLVGLSFQKEQIAFLIAASKKLAEKPMKERRKLLEEKAQQIIAIDQKIFLLEQRYMNSDIETSTYKTWFQKYKVDKAILESELNLNKEKKGTVESIIERVLPSLRNVFDIYEKGNIFQKHSIVRVLFKENLAYGGGSFRTNYIHPAFHANALEMNAKGLLFYEQAFENSNNNLVSTQEEIRTPTPVRAPAPQAGASTNFAT